MSDVLAGVVILIIGFILGAVAFTMKSKEFSVLSITKDVKPATPGKDPAGIPFYCKKGVCKQETIWVEPVFTLTYTKTMKSRWENPGATSEPHAPVSKTLTPSMSTGRKKSQTWTTIFPWSPTLNCLSHLTS